jgi:hypothetical protein
MFDWLRRRKQPQPAPAPQASEQQTPNFPPLSEATAEDLAPIAAFRLQHAYWQANPREKAALLARDRTTLSWAEILRLHHLNCRELLESKEGQRVLTDADADFSLDRISHPAASLCNELATLLLSPQSPYRLRTAAVWQLLDINSVEPEETPRAQDMWGEFTNASLTHLGCLEVLRLDEQEQPVSVDFIPFSELSMVIFARPFFFRFAKLHYLDGREGEVMCPFLYGISHLSGYASDRTGRTTRFMGNMPNPHFPGGLSLAIGQQDLFVQEEGKSLTMLGLNSIAAFQIIAE